MKRTTTITFIAALMSVICAGTACAGPLDAAKNWITLEVLALVLSAVATIIGGTVGLLFGRVARTFSEAGEFLAALGSALEDSRITRDELAVIIREGREVFAVWK